MKISFKQGKQEVRCYSIQMAETIHDKNQTMVITEYMIEELKEYNIYDTTRIPICYYVIDENKIYYTRLEYNIDTQGFIEERFRHDDLRELNFLDFAKKYKGLYKNNYSYSAYMLPLNYIIHDGSLIDMKKVNLRTLFTIYNGHIMRVSMIMPDVPIAILRLIMRDPFLDKKMTLSDVSQKLWLYNDIIPQITAAYFADYDSYHVDNNLPEIEGVLNKENDLSINLANLKQSSSIEHDKEMNEKEEGNKEKYKEKEDKDIGEDKDRAKEKEQDIKGNQSEIDWEAMSDSEAEEIE